MGPSWGEASALQPANAQEAKAGRTSSSAEVTRVRGYVLDRNPQDPLPGAAVIFRSKEGQDPLQTRTNALGHFRTQVPPGPYEAIAQFTGYYRLRLRAFTARRGAVQVVSPKLMPNFEGAVRDEAARDGASAGTGGK